LLRQEPGAEQLLDKRSCSNIIPKEMLEVMVAFLTASVTSVINQIWERA
jgi:hypothetical protein